MHIYLQELKQNTRVFLIWLAIITIYCVFYISLYPTVAEFGMQDLIESYPEALLSAFDLNTLNMTEILGYFAMEGHLLVLLFGGIFAAMMAGNILAKEESERTIEFLYAKPITRNQIVTGKLLSLLTYIVLLNIIVFSATYITIKMVYEKSFDEPVFLYFALGSLLAHTALALTSFFISSLLSRSKNVLSIAVGISLVTYAFNVIAKMAEKVEPLRYLSPFYYANAADIIQKGAMEGTRIIILLGISLAAAALTYLVYNRKDFAI
ncbi:MAG: ABC transporter permease [Clostridiales bacterium]|nr:ABC transporter permease [Clostridiales bacterium]MCF8023481.1 ABC transporter permease [Clostridiales bacterium]